MLRRFLENLSRNKVVKRHLPARFGGTPIFVSPDSALSYWKRDLETPFRSLFEWAATYVSNGDVVWDIGANVGLFALAAAHVAGPGGQVIAVEPDGFLVQLLRKSAHERGSRHAPIKVIPAAVSQQLNLATLHVARRGRSSNHLSEVPGSTMHGGVRHEEHVITVTLDWLSEISARPNVVKIDVEGAELLALTGGKQMLQSHRPLLICEVRPQTRQPVTRLFHDFDYALFDAERRSGGELDAASFNTLAIPRERVGDDAPPAKEAA